MISNVARVRRLRPAAKHQRVLHPRKFHRALGEDCPAIACANSCAAAAAGPHGQPARIRAL